MRLTAAILITSVCYLAGPLVRAQSSDSASDADFEYFKTRVQPIFRRERRNTHRGDYDDGSRGWWIDFPSGS